MGLGAVVHITKFRKDLFRHSNVHRGDTQTNRKHSDRISLLSFSFQNKKEVKMNGTYFRPDNICGETGTAPDETGRVGTQY
jgi:hypothetical protein